ncbi:hypothetical protein FHT72_006325, partial [Rhizobium sp. BK077]|uniref:DUF1016 N-terminal domain-containing protein n=1 Tax=unclassified Rhizobium TaxID=2613769 RepID=UPI00183F7349
MTTLVPAPDGSYASLLSELKERIRAARLKAAVAVNRELTLLYWSIGRDILARQTAEGWGARVGDVKLTAGEEICGYPAVMSHSPVSYKRHRF